MDDIFTLLTPGLKFNRKINGEAIKVFTGRDDNNNSTKKSDLIDTISGGIKSNNTKRKLDTLGDSSVLNSLSGMQ